MPKMAVLLNGFTQGVPVSAAITATHAIALKLKLNTSATVFSSKSRLLSRD